ncbi:MAG: C13 family peptidase [Cellvibrionaceae bacterium]
MFKIIFTLLCGFIIGAVLIENKQYFNKTVASPVAFLPDGGEYDGGLLKGEPSGEGRIVWPDGRYYEGGFKNGFFHGLGAYKERGYSYEGEYSEGIAKGKGIITFGDDRVYKGEVNNGKANGQGILTFGAGEYIGEFKDNQFDGTGKLVRTNGDIYEGGFKENLFDGEGLFTSASGKIYKGRFEKGSIIDVGDYRDGQASYTGEFKQWAFHGLGDYSDDTQSYQGQFADNVFNGSGEYKNNKGETYSGEFVNGLYHGEGLLVTADERYQGQFEYGLKHGSGVLSYSQPLDGISQVKGIWHYGKIIQSDNALVEHDASRIVEHVLYQQQQSIVEAINRIEENDTEQIELYFVGVAGDGQQGVFRREVNFIRNQFDQHYGTEGKSLLLINGDVAYETVPLATETSIKMALQGVAEKMDAENDILFVYFTSHGSSDFYFQLAQPGLELASLSADNMGAIMRSLPVRHKVAVISACYSGGYVGPVKDSSTMVITAASADRTSFGCSDNATMTYFGEAFFKDALPQSLTFVEAFDKARDIVKGREAKEGFKHSNPLIFKPQSIRKQLALWREALKQSRLEKNRQIE